MQIYIFVVEFLGDCMCIRMVSGAVVVTDAVLVNGEV